MEKFFASTDISGTISREFCQGYLDFSGKIVHIINVIGHILYDKPKKRE